jgi:hypothetical protein
MNQISCRAVLFLCLLSLLSTTLGLPAAGANHGNVKVSVRVWEFDSKLALQNIGPVASLFPPPAPAFPNDPPAPQPVLSGMPSYAIQCDHSSAMKAFRALEADFGAKGHPEFSRTVLIGQEVAYAIPFATEKLEMRVLTALACRIRDDVALLISFPVSARSVNPIMEVRSSRYSTEDHSYILCRTETTGGGFHHTMILLEEVHFGIAGQDSVTRTRNKLQRWILPETHLEPMTSLQLIEWLAQKSRKLDKHSDGSPGRGLNFVWISEPRQTPDLSKVPHVFCEQTMREFLFRSIELSSLDLAIEPHALIFHIQASHTECSPGETRTRLFPVKPQILERFPDNAAINAAAKSSNIPIYEQGGFTLDRERLILTCRQIPEHFLRSEKWLRDQKLLDETPLPAPKPPAALVRAGKIILPQLDLRRASLAEAVKAIEQAAASADPPVKNLKILIEPSDLEEPVITMFTRGMPAAEALRYCADLSYRRIVANDSAIILRPVTSTKLEP